MMTTNTKLGVIRDKASEATSSRKLMKWDTEQSHEKKVQINYRHDLLECIENKELLINGNIMDRSTRHIVLKSFGNIGYETGDHLCVTPTNEEITISRFIACFAYELKETATKLGFISVKGSTQSSNDPWTLLHQYPFYVEYVEDDHSRMYPTKKLVKYHSQ